MGTIKTNKSSVFTNSDLTKYDGEYDITFTEHTSNFQNAPKYYRFTLTYDGNTDIKRMISQNSKVLLADNIYLDIRHIYASFPKEITGWGYIKKINN